ncbi:MAG: hypothetical protein NUV84_02705 [Candidatus Uhrbacteria bacterium]|nr:hypothetical protein [Candidatus Uhrbacteria bacterium]
MVKRTDDTSYKQTAIGIIPRSKLIPLEVESQRGRVRYVRALQAADAGDRQPLEELIGDALEEAANKLDQF